MTIIIKCDRCMEEKEFTDNEWRGESGTSYQKIGDTWHILCNECLEKHDHLVRVQNVKHQAEKRKSLELWLNNKYD